MLVDAVPLDAPLAVQEQDSLAGFRNVSAKFGDLPPAEDQPSRVVIREIVHPILLGKAGYPSMILTDLENGKSWRV